MSKPKKDAKPGPEAAPKEADPSGKPGKKKLLLLLVPVLLIAVGAGLWFSGILPPLLGLGKTEAAKEQDAKGHAAPKGEPAPGAEAEAKLPIFVDVPDVVANLNAGQHKTSFIKLKARLELSRTEDQAVVTAAMPRLQDLFTTYLREVRPEELRGSVGTYRLREELLARANIAVTPARVLDVLFTEMLVQ
jgi:flagellar FliL protein